MDTQSIINDLTSKAIDFAVTKGIDLAAIGGKKIHDAIRLDFSEYLEKTINRTSYVKTLINRDEPVRTHDVYVRTYFKISNRTVDDEHFLSDFVANKRCIVEGTAGCGKSMFMRHLFLQLVENTKGYIPLFVELRQVNSVQAKDLISFIYHNTVKAGAIITQEQFKKLLKQGLFIIILDGFDEIDFDHRDHLQQQIIDLQDECNELRIIISSRPDDRFGSWTQFKIFRIQPMQEKEVVSLIKNLDYDPPLKKKFISEIKKSLYKRHSSFLSNPLLATMMLMTFDQFAHIPDKVHIFYEQAFETLFFKHDASKQAGYRRKMYTSLAIDDFKNCLSAMSLVSYYKEKFLFKESELRDFVKQAKKIEKVEFNNEDYVKDLLESVCILQRDGTYITYTHRSFQEYFTAVFISRSQVSSVRQILDRIAVRMNDNSIKMAFDMNRTLIEREWILPRLTEIINELEPIIGLKDYVRYIEILLGNFSFFRKQGGEIDFGIHYTTSNLHFYFLIESFYTNDFKSVSSFLRNFTSTDRETLVKHLGPRFDRLLLERSDGTRKNSYADNLNLSPEDNTWINNTNLAKYCRSQFKALNTLRNKLEKSIESKEQMLEHLLKIE